MNGEQPNLSAIRNKQKTVSLTSCSLFATNCAWTLQLLAEDVEILQIWWHAALEFTEIMLEELVVLRFLLQPPAFE